MILLCSCTCGGVENLLKRVLKEAGITDWLSMPLHKGKDKTRRAIAALPEQIREKSETKAFLAHISHKSKYAAVFGYSEENDVVIWADVARGSTKERIDAQNIAKLYNGIR